MRLGGPLLAKPRDPDDWIKQLKHYGYTAAYCPVGTGDDDAVRKDYVQAARTAGIVVAEVGAWSNPISPDTQERNKAIKHCQEQLALADEVGACCCVNIAGSRGARWDGPDRANLTDETFQIIVEAVRAIVDAVKPSRTFYTLETMPWSYPDSTDSYLRLIEAIDRKQFAVHFDPVNMICSPQRYFGNAEIINDFVSKLGSHIKSSHAKDIALAEKLTVHLDEVQPGLGALDYRVLLKQLDSLGPDTPLLLEHLQQETQYLQAAQFVRSTASDVGVTIL